jgi:hypothetical protein
MGWIYLAEDRDDWWAVVNVMMNLQVFIKCREFLDCLRTVSCSRRTLLCGFSQD